MPAAHFRVPVANCSHKVTRLLSSLYSHPRQFRRIMAMLGRQFLHFSGTGATSHQLVRLIYRPPARKSKGEKNEKDPFLRCGFVCRMSCRTPDSRTRHEHEEG